LKTMTFMHGVQKMLAITAHDQNAEKKYPTTIIFAHIADRR